MENSIEDFPDVLYIVDNGDLHSGYSLLSFTYIQFTETNGRYVACNRPLGGLFHGDA